MEMAFEWQREEILNKANNFEKFAVKGKTVTLICSDCTIVLQVGVVQRVELVFVYYFPKAADEKPLEFWINKSSMSQLGDKLRSSAFKRVPWTEVPVLKFQ